ncbi:hypothetical protein BsWGS_14000 [Bradybaena similaris]
MIPAGRVQLIVGAFATTIVAFLSYFVVKRRLVRGNNDPDIQEGVTREHVEGAVSSDDESVSSEVKSCDLHSCSFQVSRESQHQKSEHTGGGENENAERRKDKLADEGQEQTSFIVLDNGEDAVPPDNGQHPKKSDRSSDESSYDVIDDEEQLAEAAEEGDGVEEGDRDEGEHALAVSSESKQQDPFLDENETSMVIIEDLDHSNQSKSGSSFYASADENTEVVSRLDETRDEEKDKFLELSDVAEDSSSTPTADSKLPSADFDYSLLSDKDKMEDEQPQSGSSGYRSGIREASSAPEDTVTPTVDTKFLSTDFDYSLLSDKDKGDDDLAWEGSFDQRSEAEASVSSGQRTEAEASVFSYQRSEAEASVFSDQRSEAEASVSSDQRSEAEASLSSDAPLTVPEASPDKSAVETTEIVTSRLNVVLKSESDATQETEAKEDVELEAGDITEILTVCQNSPSTVSKENIRLLVSLLRKKIPELHSTVLNCVLRVAAFTQNVKTLRDNGCLEVVADQVIEACRTVGGGEGAETLNSVCQVLTNLTLDPKCQTELQETVPSLIDRLLSSDSEQIKLSLLRPLINFSSQPSFHSHYTGAVQSLYNLVETGSHIAKVQSLKILVNLSLNEDTVPQLLAAKAPSNLMELLDSPTPTDLILRTLTMLANIELALYKGSVSIPEEVKTASPETVYMVLHGTNRLPVLRSKVLRLTRHSDEDVSHQASKLNQYIQEKPGSVKQ